MTFSRGAWKIVALYVTIFGGLLAGGLVAMTSDNGPTAREYALYYPTCHSSEDRHYCFSKEQLPCTPNGWEDVGWMVCDKATTVWRCPALIAPFDDGHFESLRCWNYAFSWADGRVVPPDWRCELSLYTYMDPRKWGQ